VRVIVDLTRCQGYGQCAFWRLRCSRCAARRRWHPDADDAQREHVLRAAACPVQAIHVEWMAIQHKGTRAAAARPALGDGDGLRKTGRVVIVGASLAGGRAAGVLRREGFTGGLTVIGDEPYEPYDRPPLSKQVLAGRVPADHTLLPHLSEIEAEWLSGAPATGLDLVAKRVTLADGREVPFDRLLIATGARARPWPNAVEATLDGVLAIRTMDEAIRLREHLAAGPRRASGWPSCPRAEVGNLNREPGQI
jgi:ferredoxin